MTQVRAFAAAADRDLADWRCIVNAHDPDEIAPLLPRLIELGVTDVVVDLDYDTPDGPQRAFQVLREAAA